MKKFLLPLTISILSFNTIQRTQTIQLDVSAILNARPVTTLSHGKLTTWIKGIDGNGAGDGYLTMSAALFKGDKQPHALPDNPIFAADAFHPQIVLHYNNNDSTNYQARYVSGEDSFTIAVPAHVYNSMYLCLTSAEGPSQLQFQLVYEDGIETKDFLLPDYYNDLPANDINIAYLAHNLAKWDSGNKMKETDHHNIDVVNIHPNPKRILTTVKLKKTKPGYLVFWAATGVIAK